MQIGAGSANPVKRRAVEAAVAATGDPFAGAAVEARAVDSGVSEQPRGREETIPGAENPARRARRAGGYDPGVGVEGGAATVEGAPGLCLIVWAAAAGALGPFATSHYG